MLISEGRDQIIRIQCSHCHGSRKIDGKPCPYCGGKGFLVKKKITKIQKIREQAPVNSMGASSSTHGTGSIDTYDPILRKKPLERFLSFWKKSK